MVCDGNALVDNCERSSASLSTCSLICGGGVGAKNSCTIMSVPSKSQYSKTSLVRLSMSCTYLMTHVLFVRVMSPVFGLISKGPKAIQSCIISGCI